MAKSYRFIHNCRKKLQTVLARILIVLHHGCGKLLFTAPITTCVIANQCSHWCGDPPDIPETLWDCHVGLSGLLAMTFFYLTSLLNHNLSSHFLCFSIDYLEFYDIIKLYDYAPKGAPIR